MKIKLSEIHPNPNPVRKTWDKDKLEELAQSIHERGLIVPIKVRPNSGGYEIVYGHGRFRAAQHIGLLEIPAIVEGMDEETAEEQALIENVVRAAMHPLEEAKVIERWHSPEPDGRGWTAQKIGAVLGKTIDWVNKRILLLEEPEITKSLLGRLARAGKPEFQEFRQPIGERHVRAARILPLPEQREPILIKAHNEQLSAEQVRNVAESYASAKSPATKKAILEAAYSSHFHDPEFHKKRAEQYGEHDTAFQEKTVDRYQMTPEAKAIIDKLRTWTKEAEEMRESVKLGKFSPEGRGFVAIKVESLLDTLDSLLEELRYE